MNTWKNPTLLILGIGVSFLGNWIYLIALNISILNLTGSAAAVAGLYIIRPVAILLTNIWSGSIVDRVNKRRMMITIDLIRGILVSIVPFIGSLWTVYTILLLINMAGAFFGPSSSVYITKLIPPEKRKRFNSIMSMTNSGAFLLGPAISGILLMSFSPKLCILINALTFFICAFIIYFLPNVEENEEIVKEPIRFKQVKKDWSIVIGFAKHAKFFLTVYVLFQMSMLIGFALDSQEVTFIKQNLKLSDQNYGIIVSLAGIGAMAGAAVCAMLSKVLSLRFYLGGGMLLSSLGYILFYTSYSFITAILAFVFLGFFLAFANAGYTTFFQNNVPVNIMGRFGSIADMIQGILQIGFTLLLGITAELYSLQFVCLVFSVVGSIFAIILIILVLVPSKMEYFNEKSKEITG